MPLSLFSIIPKFKASLLLSLLCLITSCGGGSSSNDDNKNNVVAKILLSRANNAGLTAITFDGSASEVTGDNAEYLWNFGDGSSATGITANHSYNLLNLRPYTATLTVTDSSGNSDTASIATTYSISGTISPASNTAVDIDVNDPSRQNKAQLGPQFETNNNASEPQALPNPVILNGFVNASPAADTSDNSNFNDSTDTDDFYSVYLTTGQFVSLQVADFNIKDSQENDIDLYLYDNNGMLLLSSASDTQYESVSAPTDGDFIIGVNAANGISKYILVIGNSSLASGRAAYGQPANIIPGEAIVKTKPTTNTISSNRQSTSASHTTGPSLIKLTITSANTFTTSQNNQSVSSQLLQKNYAVLSTLQQIKELNRQNDVEYAEPNYRVNSQLTPNDSFYSYQWHYPQINLPQAWDITTGTPASGDDIIVAVVDTGVILNHEDLMGQLISGYDFIRDTNTSQDGDGIDDNPDDPGDGDNALSSSWHGTHVAGTIAAASNNNQGVTGVAWGAKLMPIRVLGQGGGSSYDVIQGIRYAARLDNDSNNLPTNAADIINLSLSGGGFSQSTQDLFNQLNNAGIIVVAAAGNESTSTPSYPASYDHVISVSATDINNDLAPYSNYGSYIDVAAPGGDVSIDRNGDGYIDGVLSTLNKNDSGSYNYAFYEGTSMATPHISGVAALMKAVHPDLSGDEFLSSLQNGLLSTDAGATGRDDDFGYGIINALKSVQQAQSLAGGTSTGSLLASPNRIDFGTINTQRNLSLTGIGNNPPSIIGPTLENLSWLTINNPSTGEYELTADRSDLGDAIYSGNIEFELDNGTLFDVPVTMTIQSSGSATSDAGYLYILLLDADSYEYVTQLQIDVSNGEYNYNFSNIPFGEYVILAGSDIDNDLRICNLGESCGSYPTNNQLVRIVLDGSQEGINFLASVTSNVINSTSTTSTSSLPAQKIQRKTTTSQTNDNKKIED